MATAPTWFPPRHGAAANDDAHARDARLLIVPGLHGSGSDHWQTWLERRVPGAVRIELPDWGHADLARWAGAIDDALRQHRAAGWVVAAHSFGCLALAHYAARGGRGVQGALLAAPANPDRFALDEAQLNRPLPFGSTLVASANDPWMSFADACYFARRWGSELVDAGEAGHINPATGFGPWPEGQSLVERHLQRVRAGGQPLVVPASPPLRFAW
jgi:predicted alpha/beta hydrolase family esterase